MHNSTTQNTVTSTRKPQNNGWKKLILSVLVTIVLVYVLLHYISLNDVKELMGKIKIQYVVISLIPYFLCYVARTLRFKVLLLDEKITVSKLFQVHSVHNMLNSILPASLGELSYLFLLKKNAQIRLRESTSSLLISRFMDFSVMIGFFFLSCFALKERVFSKLTFIPYAAFGGFLLLICSYLVLLRLGNLKWSVRKAGIIPKLINKLMYVLREIGLTMQALSSGGRLLWGIVFSLLSMNGIFLFYFYVIRGLGIQIGYMEIIFVSSILVPLMLLPVKGLAGFGTHEIGWAVGFLILGFNKELSILTGFAIHIVSLIFVVGMGLQGIIALNYKT